MNRVIKFSCLATLLFSQAVLVQAAGVLVKPAELKFALTVGQSASQFLNVENISGRPVLYHVYADELEDQITIEPTDFRLEVKEKQRFKVIFKPKQPGLGAVNLSIVAQDLDRREFNVATGVKVPLAFAIAAAPPNPFSLKNLLAATRWSIIIFLAPTLLLLVFWLFRRKRKSVWQQLFSQSVNLLKHHKPWWKRMFD